MIALRRLVTVPLATALSVCVLVSSPLLLAARARWLWRRDPPGRCGPWVWRWRTHSSNYARW